MHNLESERTYNIFRVEWVIVNNCSVKWSTSHHYWSEHNDQKCNWPLFTGLWYYVGGRDHPCLTLIGSPNFGYRSVHRDLEAQIAIVTENEELQMRLQQVGLPLRHCLSVLGSYWAHITYKSCVGMFNSCCYYLWVLWLIFVRVYWKHHKKII